VAALSKGVERGDEDPLDICVVTEWPIGRSKVVAPARVVDVLRGVGQESDWNNTRLDYL
jgi:inorganic pyrophosphatase